MRNWLRKYWIGLLVLGAALVILLTLTTASVLPPAQTPAQSTPETVTIYIQYSGDAKDLFPPPISGWREWNINTRIESTPVGESGGKVLRKYTTVAEKHYDNYPTSKSSPDNISIEIWIFESGKDAYEKYNERLKGYTGKTASFMGHMGFGMTTENSCYVLIFRKGIAPVGTQNIAYSFIYRSNIFIEMHSYYMNENLIIDDSEVWLELICRRLIEQTPVVKL